MDDINDSNKDMVDLTTEELCDLLEALDFKIDYKEKDSEEDLQPRKKRQNIGFWRQNLSSNVLLVTNGFINIKKTVYVLILMLECN